MEMDKILYTEIVKAMDEGQISSFVDVSLTGDNELTLFLEDGTSKKLLIQENVVGFDNLENDPIAQDLVECLDAEFVKFGALSYKGKYNLALEEEEETATAFEIFIDDLLPDVKEKLIKFLGDNGNYDVFPMVTIYREGDEE